MTQFVCFLVAALAGLATAAWGATPREGMLVTLSKHLLQVGLQAPISETRTISDSIMDTAVSGTAFTTGSLTIDLIPSDQWASITLNVNTQTESHTRGDNSPRDDIDVTISSTSHTQMISQKSIFLEPEGISTTPAVSSAQTTLDYDAIDVDAEGLFWRLKTNIAANRAWEQAWATKADNERRISETAARDMNESLDRKTNSMLSSFNRLYYDVFYKPIFVDGVSPRSLRFSSTSESVSAKVDATVPEAAPPPPAFVGGNEFSVRAHQSLLSSYFSESLGKTRKLNEEDLEEFLISHGIIAGLGHYHPGDAQILFDFCQDRPFTVELSTLQIQLTLCLDQIEFKGVKSGPVQIKLTYFSRITPEGTQEMGRVDDPDLSATSPFAPEAVQEILKRLGRLFPEQVTLPKPRLPGKLGSQELTIHRADLGNEWIVIEYWFDPSKGKKSP